MTTDSAGLGGGAVDLAALARTGPGPIPLWVDQSADLHVNVLTFDAGAGVAEHVNAELDVLLLGIAGEGAVVIDGVEHPLHAGNAILIPKGAKRSIRCVLAPFSYLSCHRRRAMLWPQGARR